MNFLWVGVGWCELLWVDVGWCELFMGGCKLFMGGCGLVWVGVSFLWVDVGWCGSVWVGAQNNITDYRILISFKMFYLLFIEMID